MLAAAILDPEGAASESDEVVTTPEAFSEAGLIALSEPLSGTAELAVVVAGGPVPDDGEAGRRLDALTAVPAAFDSEGAGAVLAGPPESATSLGVVDAVRNDADLAAAVSTVDMAHISSGRTSATLALEEQWAGGVGHYGGVGQVDGPAPSQS